MEAESLYELARWQPPRGATMMFSSRSTPLG